MIKAKDIIVIGAISLLIVAYALPFLGIESRAGSTRTTFNLSTSVASGSFSTYISASGTSVKPGGSTTITFDAEQGGASLTVYLGSYGSESISFSTPLSSVSIPVSGISGVASVNVDLSGTLEGDLSVSGPGSLSTTHLSWNSWGKRSVTLNAANAKDGDKITVTLNLEYTGHIGASGKTFLGSITLISPQSLPGVQGSPPVTLTVDVKESKGVGSIPGFEMIIAIGAVIAAITLWKRY